MAAMTCLACLLSKHHQCWGCDCCSDPLTRVRAAVDELVAAVHAAYPPEVFAARRPLLAELAAWVAADEPAEVPVPRRIGVDPQDREEAS